jgi:hypothetical protein
MTLTPGQRGFYTFAGTAGQKLGLGFTNTSLSAGGTLTYTVLKPDGSVLNTETWSGTNASDVPVLPVSGTYTLKMEPSVNTGTASVNIWLSSDITGTLAPGGAATTFSIMRPGQNGRYTFTATAGQNLALASTGNTFSNAGYATVYKPDGTVLGSMYFGTSFNAANLPAGGTYTVVVNPAGVSTGSLSMSLTLN